MMSAPSKFSPGLSAPPLDIEALESLPVAADGAIQFDFIFRDLLFAARYSQDGGKGLLRLAGDCGPYPFTAESPEARSGLRQIVSAANDVLGQTFRIRDGRILLAAVTEVPPPVSVTHVVTAAAVMVVPAIPYLELIATYVRPPLERGKPGEPAVRAEWRRRARAKA